MIRRRTWLVLGITAPWAATAHEIDANRATLVLREGRHLALTLQIDLAAALQRTLAPAQPLARFAAAHAALPVAQIDTLLAQARRRIEAETSITLGRGQPIALTHWRWPSAERTHALLQRATMRALVGGSHDDEGLVEVRAEGLAPGRVDVVHLRLPEPLQPLLVVWSKPQQAWSRAGATPLRADFR